MAKSKKPRKPYRPPNYNAEAARLNPAKYGERGRPLPAKGSEEALDMGRQLSQAKMPEDTVRFHDEPQATKPKAPRARPIHKEPPAPAHPHVVHPPSPRAPSGRGRYLVPVAAGAGVIGAGGYLAHRARRRKTVVKGLIDPLTGGTVTFEKRYIEDDVDGAPRGALVSKSKMKLTSEAGDIAFRQRARDTAVAAGRKAGKKVTWERSALVSGGTLAGAALPRRSNTAKRYDETAVDHHGSRRSRRTPVHSVRVPGLPVQSARFSQGHTWERPGTSHENKLHHTHTKVKAPRDGRLFHLKKNDTSVGKSAGYGQTGAAGRRLLGV